MYSASRWPLCRHSPCAFAYASTSAICSGFASGEFEVADGLLVDREDAAGTAELRRHVRNRRTVGERQAGEAVAEELDELVHHSLLAEHLGDREHEVGCGRSGGQAAPQSNADDLRDQHRDRLPEHGCLRLDAADAPAQYAETVHHGRMGIRADQRVRESALDAVAFVREHDTRQVLDVHLVHDSGVRWHDLEIAECALSPAQERVTLAVAGKLYRVVLAQRVGRAVLVHLHRVIYDEFRRRERIDLLGAPAQGHHRLAHRGEIDDGGDPGEVLHDHARRRERDLVAGRRLRVPLEQGLDVLARDGDAVFEAQQVLEKDLERIGQAIDVVAFDRGQAADLVGLAAHRQRLAGLETVSHESSGMRTEPTEPRNYTGRRRAVGRGLSPAPRPAAAARDSPRTCRPAR